MVPQLQTPRGLCLDKCNRCLFWKSQKANNFCGKNSEFLCVTADVIYSSCFDLKRNLHSLLDSSQGQEIYLHFAKSRPCLGPTYPPINEWRAFFFPAVRRPERGIDHLPPYNVEVKNEGTYIRTPRIFLHGVHEVNICFKGFLGLTI